MQAAIHLLKRRLEVNEERKDFQKIFVRHVRHSDCREMKMTVWTLRYVVAEFLDIKVSEKSLKDLACLLAELGFADRNCRVSITDFFDSVIEPKQLKCEPTPGKTKHLRNASRVYAQLKKKNSSEMSTPRKTSAVVKDTPETSGTATRKQRSLSLSRPSILNLKFFHSNKPNSSSASRKSVDGASKDTQCSTCQSTSNSFGAKSFTPQSFEEFMRKQQSQINSAAELQKSLKIIQNSYNYLNGENGSLQKEISNIQAEICELQKNNDLLRDFSLRLKLKTLSERERLDHNTVVLVRALNNLRELHNNHTERQNCASCSHHRVAKETLTPNSGDVPISQTRLDESTTFS